MSRRHDEIIESYLNGEADEVELRAWLSRSDAHVDEFVAACDLHWRLKDAVTDRASSPAMPGDRAASRREPNVRRLPWRAAGWAMAATLAIAGLVAAILFVIDRAEPDQPVRVPVAVLMQDNGVRWSSAPDGMVPGAGDTLVSGRYEIAAGSIVFETRRGVTVTVSGPASVSLESDMRTFLSGGYLEARVPGEASGFEVATPTMSVVDLGTEFAVSVDELGDAWVDVFEGEVVATALDGSRRRIGPSLSLGAGDRATSPRDTRQLVRLEGSDTPRLLRQRVTGPIHLGNLFDDDKSIPLARAIESDRMGAVADADDLGVWRVGQGADSVQEVAPDVWVEFRELGWAFEGWGRIANDVWTAGDGKGSENPRQPIRTLGKRDGLGTERIEQGIGLHADGVLVFDLDELRRSGRLFDKPLRLLVDRAGINDDAFGNGGSVHLAVIVVTADGAVDAFVHGGRAELYADANGVWRFERQPKVLTYDGVFASFDIPLPPAARYVAFVTTAAGDGTGMDHGVFSGARIEIESTHRETSPGKDRASN